MIAIDTNVLVRYVVADDDAAQGRAAARLLDECCSPQRRALVGPVVLAEFVWVLRKTYGIAKSDIVAALTALGNHAHLAFDTEAEFLAALDAWRERPVDFADCLVAARALTLGATDLFTFDERAARGRPFRKLETGA